MHMDMDRSTTACFSGYRPEKFPFTLNADDGAYITFKANLGSAVSLSVSQGYRAFICGMSRGFDLIAALVVLEHREAYPHFSDIKLICAAPFAGQRFNGDWERLHRRVRRSADAEVAVSAQYDSQCFYRRNLYMVKNSSRLICYWSGERGGTAQTVALASENGLDIINLAQILN